MTPLLMSMLVILITLVVIYVSTRSLPPAWSPGTKCKTNSDCSFPAVCNLKTQLCVDPNVSVLLNNAQMTATAFYNSYQNIVANFADLTNITALTYMVQSMGSNMPDLTKLNSSRVSGLVALHKYNIQVLAVPGCVPTISSNCGYYSQIMAATPQSPTTMWATALNADSLLSELPLATQAFSPLADNMSSLLSLLSADAQARQISISQPAVVVNFDNYISQLNSYAGILTTLATDANVAGKNLYAHYINV